MKKLLTILFTFLCFASQAQKIIARAGVANTVQDERLAAKKNIILPRYNDTTQANATLGLDSCGAAIYTRDDNKIWYRQCSPKKWVEVLGAAGGGNNCGLNSGGLVTWAGTGLTFDVTAASYCINNNSYNFAGGAITLNAADPTLDRFDAIVLTNTGTVAKITGTPSASPAIPTANPGTQLYLTAVLVKAGSTIPYGMIQTVLWNENIGSPEWAAAGGAYINYNGITTPYNGSKAADATGAFVTGDQMRFTGTAYTLANYSSLKFFLKLKNQLTKLSSFQVQIISAGNIVTQPITINATNGYNASVTGSYQNITIPISQFTFQSSVSVIDGIVITLTNTGSTGFYFDYLTLQGGSSTGGGQYVTSTFKKAGTDSVFYVVGGIPYFSHLSAITSFNRTAIPYANGSGILTSDSTKLSYTSDYLNIGTVGATTSGIYMNQGRAELHGSFGGMTFNVGSGYPGGGTYDQTKAYTFQNRGNTYLTISTTGVVSTSTFATDVLLNGSFKLSTGTLGAGKILTDVAGNGIGTWVDRYKDTVGLHWPLQAYSNAGKDSIRINTATAALTDGATTTWNYSTNINATWTMAGSRTLAITNDEDGSTGALLVTQDATGGRTITFPGGDNTTGVTQNTGANAKTLYTYLKIGSIRYWNATLR
jgi:hypothetical protein